MLNKKILLKRFLQNNPSFDYIQVEEGFAKFDTSGDNRLVEYVNIGLAFKTN